MTLPSNSGQRVLVTGATGFIGRHVVRYLVERNYEVRALVRQGRATFLPIKPNLELTSGDVTDAQSLRNAISGVWAVVHLAANKYHRQLAHEVNVGGAHNLIVSCRDMGVRRIINVSTQSTKIKRKGVYGRTKLEADKLFESSGLDVTTLRPSLVYGPEEDTLFGFIAKQIRTLPVVPVIGDGRWVSRPVHVEDLAAAIETCVVRPETIGRVYDIGGTDAVSFDELIDRIGREIGIRPRKVHIPFSIGLGVASAVARVLPNPPITPDNVLGSNQDTQIDTRAVDQELQLQPRTLDQGISEALAHRGQGARDTEEKCRVGIVGLGRIGMFHAAVLSQVREAEVVAIADGNRKLAATARTMGVKAEYFPSLKELIHTAAPDAVFICTPTFTHLALAQQCLAQDIHVFLEKPATRTPEDARALRLAVGAARSVSGVGYFYRHRRTYRHARRLLRENAIGKPMAFSATSYHSEVLEKEKRGWMFEQQKSGGGALINPSSHLIDLLYWYFGLPVSVTASAEQIFSREVEDRIEAQAEYASGLLGKLEANWSVPNKPVLEIQIEVLGESGRMSIGHDEIVLELDRSTEQWQKGRTVIRESQIERHGEAFDLNTEGGGEAYYLSDRAFVTKCLGAPIGEVVSLEEAAEAERLMHGIYEAAHTGRRATLE
jgi:predicted dehydrogenase/nucleoside-diphosphate-sugar epimerase